MVYIYDRFRENILDSLRVMAISLLIHIKGHNSLNITCRAIVLVICTLSNHDLHLFQVCENISNGF